MKTITLVTQKGGAGKTTLAASLAVAAEEAGEKVVLIDLDPQASLIGWSHDRNRPSPSIDRLEPTLIPKLPQVIAALRKKGFTLMIMDTAGIDSTTTHLAMQSSDLCLIPSRPTRLDVRATKPTYEAAIRMSKRFLFVLNQCPPQPNNPRAVETANGLAMLGIVAEPLIMQRADHQDAFASGLGVTEYAPDSKAADEIRSLWKWLLKELNGKEKHEQKTLIKA